MGSPGPACIWSADWAGEWQMETQREFKWLVGTHIQEADWYHWYSSYVPVTVLLLSSLPDQVSLPFWNGSTVLYSSEVLPCKEKSNSDLAFKGAELNVMCWEHLCDSYSYGAGVPTLVERAEPLVCMKYAMTYNPKVYSLSIPTQVGVYWVLYLGLLYDCTWQVCCRLPLLLSLHVCAYVLLGSTTQLRRWYSRKLLSYCFLSVTWRLFPWHFPQFLARKHCGNGLLYIL